MGAWGKDAHGGIPRCFWPKSYNVGGVLLLSFFLLIAQTEFRPITGWPKRAYYGESGVENDVFEASPLGGLGTEFPCF